MKLLVISSSITVPHEHSILNSLFEEGLEIFHIHKPDLSEKEIIEFILQISEKYHSKIFLHSDFPKFHSLEELKHYKEKYEYAFLSPVFDSISKKGYKSKFSYKFHKFSQINPDSYRDELISAISGKNIIALGGIDEDKIEICRQLGFAGVAVLGAIWKNANPMEKFKRLKLLCHSERSEESIMDASLRSA